MAFKALKIVVAQSSDKRIKSEKQIEIMHTWE